jgi:protein O-mannosyl-transferase
MDAILGKLPVETLNPSTTRSRLLPIILIGLITLFAYVRGLENQFVAEDFLFVTQFNASFDQAWQSMLTSSRLWPIGVVYRWVLYQISGTNPIGYHVASLAIHIVNALLVYYIANRLSRDRRIGWTAAILFALYPRNHQPVLWMSGNLVPFSTLFSLICVYAFERYLSAKRMMWYGLTLLTLALALLSLEGTVVLFPILVAMEYLLFHDFKLGNVRSYLIAPSRLLKYIPIVIIFGLYFFINFGGARAYKLGGEQIGELTDLNQVGLERGDSYHFSVGLNSLKEGVVYLVYAIYPQIPLRALDANLPAMILAGITILLLLALFIKGTNFVRFSLIWMVVSLIPYVFFATFGNADRYFYLAAIGFAWALGWLIWKVYDWLASRQLNAARAFSFAAIGLYCAASLVIIQERVYEWRVAGEMASDILDQAVALYPDPPTDSTLIYFALPRQFGQAYVYNSAFVSAIRLRYGEKAASLNLYQSQDPQVIERLTTSAPAENSLTSDIHPILYIDGVLEDKTQVISDRDSLNPNTWSQW